MTDRAAIPESHRDLVDKPIVGTLATVGADGRPQVTAIWFLLDGDVIRASLVDTRQKYKNMVANPKATLFLLDPANPYRTLEIRGDVSFDDDPDLAFMEKLVRYYGMDPATFPAPKEGRVLLTLDPRRVVIGPQTG